MARRASLAAVASAALFVTSCGGDDGLLGDDLRHSPLRDHPGRSGQGAP